MGSSKRERQRANRMAKQEASLPPLPELTDADLAGLLTPSIVRDDCEHAVTRTTPDGLVLVRCSVAAASGGACPEGCGSWEARKVGGLGTGT